MRVVADTPELVNSLHETVGRRQHVAPQYLERRRARRKSSGFVSSRSNSWVYCSQNLGKGVLHCDYS